MRVQTASGQRYAVLNPSLEGDSVIGGFDESSRTRVRIQRGEVVSAEQYGSDLGSAVTAAVIVFGVVVGVWLARGAPGGT
jgi:hypothetical protein